MSFFHRIIIIQTVPQGKENFTPGTDLSTEQDIWLGITILEHTFDNGGNHMKLTDYEREIVTMSRRLDEGSKRKLFYWLDTMTTDIVRGRE